MIGYQNPYDNEQRAAARGFHDLSEKDVKVSRSTAGIGDFLGIQNPAPWKGKVIDWGPRGLQRNWR